MFAGFSIREPKLSKKERDENFACSWTSNNNLFGFQANPTLVRYDPLNQDKEALETHIWVVFWELKEVSSPFLEEEVVLQVTARDLHGVLCSSSLPSGKTVWGHLCIHSKRMAKM